MMGEGKSNRNYVQTPGYRTPGSGSQNYGLMDSTDDALSCVSTDSPEAYTIQIC